MDREDVFDEPQEEAGAVVLAIDALGRAARYHNLGESGPTRQL